MNIFFEKLKTKKYLIISESDLAELLNSSQIILERDTRLRDYIRILKLKDGFLLQETTNQGEIILRKFTNEADALKIVNDRLEIYDKMWDGCGCKINYYE